MSGLVSPEKSLGWALELEPLSPLDGPAGGLDLSFDKVEGADALIQSLALAFVTLTGADVFNRRFGFDGLAAIAEESDRVLRRERIRMAVIATLQAEPRITRIVTVRFADEVGVDGEPGHAFATPPSRVMTIEALFETAAGGRQAMIVGGEVLDVR